MKASLQKIRLPAEIYTEVPAESSLHARLLLLEEETDHFLLVQLELTSLQPYVIDTLKTQLADLLQLKPEEIWITVSHTFSAPHTRSKEAIAIDETVRRKNEAFCSMLYESVRKAAEYLPEKLQEVQISTAAAACKVNVSRDLPTPEGWWKGANPQEFSSPDLPVLILKNQQEKVIGIVCAYDLQSSWTQLNRKDAVITGDIFGQAMEEIEKSIRKASVFCSLAAEVIRCRIQTCKAANRPESISPTPSIRRFKRTRQNRCRKQSCSTVCRGSD